jgi:Nucleotide excision repair endonuclease NEF1, RAD10 subunit
MNSTDKQFNNYKPNPQNKKVDYGECWINPSQVANPVWKILKFPKKTKDQQVADFIFPDSGLSIIFLSLQFHQTYPLYLQDKLDKFAQSEDYKTYDNRILLLLFDAEDPSDHLMEITLLCMEKNIKLLLGFTFTEIASYLGSFKYLEKNKGHYKLR